METSEVMHVLLSVLLVAATSARTQKIEVDFDPRVDLSEYRTFTWNKDQKPVANMANHVRLVNAIQKQMMERGYRINSRNPDVLIQYKVDTRRAIQTRSTQQPSVWDPTDMKVQIDLSREEQVSLTLELKEAESNFLVWQVKGTYPLGTPDRSEKQIQSAVSDLFSNYPDPKAKKKE